MQMHRHLLAMNVQLAAHLEYALGASTCAGHYMQIW